jgi:hypothetical protein
LQIHERFSGFAAEVRFWEWLAGQACLAQMLRAWAVQRGTALLTTPRIHHGSCELRATEFILTYDGESSCTVSIMEFTGDKVAWETQYFADPFVAPAFRLKWVERMDT